MSGSTSLLDLITTSQAQKEVTANALFDAMSTASAFGRRASTSVGLTWGYYGGPVYAQGSPSGLVQIPNGTVALTGSTTNYIETDTSGGVTVNTSGFTPGYTPLYTVTTDASGATSYTDWRITTLGISGTVDTVNGGTGNVVLGAEDIAVVDVGGYFTGADVEAALQELGAALAAGVTTLAALTDVDIAGSPSVVDGDVLTFDSTSGKWVAAPLPIGGGPFDIPMFYPGIPTASANLYRGKVARALAIPADFAGSYFAASASATASTVFDVQKNGVSIGTVTIGAGGTTATFATTGGAAQLLAAGDLFTVVCPASPDATLADPAITFAFTR